MLHLIHAAGDLVLDEGEGMALINGSPYSTAVLADTALRARNRLAHTELAFALSIDAMRAPLEAYDEALADLWGDPHQTAALRSLRTHLAGSAAADRLGHQAPVSFRIVPRLLGEARRAVTEAERSAAVALRSVSVNPVYFPPDRGHPQGRPHRRSCPRWSPTRRTTCPPPPPSPTSESGRPRRLSPVLRRSWPWWPARRCTSPAAHRRRR